MEKSGDWFDGPGEEDKSRGSAVEENVTTEEKNVKNNTLRWGLEKVKADLVGKEVECEGAEETQV